MAAERPENIQKTLSEVKGQGQREEGGVKTGEVMTVVGGGVMGWSQEDRETQGTWNCYSYNLSEMLRLVFSPQ